MCTFSMLMNCVCMHVCVLYPLKANAQLYLFCRLCFYPKSTHRAKSVNSQTCSVDFIIVVIVAVYTSALPVTGSLMNSL